MKARRSSVELPHWPRMLNPSLAAKYCGLSVGSFRNRCPVPATDFGDRRLELYDREDLDQWLDNQKNRQGGVTNVADAMAEFRRANSGSREKSKTIS